MDIPKSTLSGWLSDIVLSEKAKLRIKGRLAKGFTERNKRQTIDAKIRAEKIKTNSFGEVGNLNQRDIIMINIALYWAEGYKRLKKINGREITAHPISMTNSDPEMVSSFLFFLKNIMKIREKDIYVNLRLFPHMDAESNIKYWSGVTGLPKSQFDRPSFVISKSSNSKRPFNRLPHGTAQLRVGDTQEFYRLMGWIEGVKKSLALFTNKV